MIKKLFYTVLGSLLACVLISYPLWLNDRTIPLVPVVEWLVLIGWTHHVFIGAWGSLFIFLMVYPAKKGPLILFLILSIVLALQDQLRWQPWFYQFLLLLLFYCLYASDRISKKELLSIFRVCLVGIYAWSGIHKFNAAFVYEYLPDVIGFEVGMIGYAIPVLETILAIGLLFARTRYTAVTGVLLMHFLILMNVLFGSMHHNLVIIPWNLAMMYLVYLLFWNRENHRFLIPKLSTFTASLIFLVLPGFNLAGMWDGYLSFGLYAEKHDKGALYVSESFKQHLPESLAPHYGIENKLNLQKFAFSELNVPFYPEERVMKGVLKTLCQRSKNEFDIILEVEHLPNALVSEWNATYFFCEDVGMTKGNIIKFSEEITLAPPIAFR